MAVSASGPPYRRIGSSSAHEAPLRRYPRNHDCRPSVTVLHSFSHRTRSLFRIRGNNHGGRVQADRRSVCIQEKEYRVIDHCSHFRPASRELKSHLRDAICFNSERQVTRGETITRGLGANDGYGIVCKVSQSVCDRSHLAGAHFARRHRGVLRNNAVTVHVGQGKGKRSESIQTSANKDNCAQQHDANGAAKWPEYCDSTLQRRSPPRARRGHSADTVSAERFHCSWPND